MFYYIPFFIVPDAPTGPRLLTSNEEARLWMKEGFRVIRVVTTETVTATDLDLEEQQAREWNTKRT